MSDLDFTICCTVTFFSKKRKTPPNLNNGKYCPHLVVKGSDQQLGVVMSILKSTLLMVKMLSLINQYVLMHCR